MEVDAVMETLDAQELVRLARDRIGLKPVLSAPKIAAILKALPADHRGGFCRDLAACDPRSSDWQSFVEALLVHETYFFRHPDQLRLLADTLLPRFLEERLAAGSSDVRIWCAGCSTGEEVYSLALLLQAAISSSALPKGGAWNATILGTDLSPSTLDRARAGTYGVAPGLNSFRDVPPFARHNFAAVLDASEARWSASRELRTLVRFAQHNLVTDPPALRDADLVICRNTLIYFEEEQSRRAVSTLAEAMRPGGALLLGPAESASDIPSLRLISTAQAVFWTTEPAG